MPTRSRYGSEYEGLDFSGLGASPEPQPKKKDDPLADFLRMAGVIAPAAGTAIGAIGGGIAGAAGGPMGILAGAGAGGALGSGIGQAAGTAATMGADMLGADEREDEAMRIERENERRARQQAGLSLLGQAG